MGRYPIDLLQSGSQAGLGSPLSSFLTLTQGLGEHPDVELHLIICDASVSRDATVNKTRIIFHLLRGLSEQTCALTLHRINARRIHRLLRKIQPDIVHGDHSGIYAYAAVTSAYPNVITLRGIFAQIMKVVPRKRFLTRWHLLSFMEERTIRKARNIISISPYVTSLIGGWFRGNIFPVENPVNGSFLEPVAEGRESRFRILFVGTLYPLKGVKDLLAAFGMMTYDRLDLRLTLAGPAHPGYREYYQGLLSFVREHGLDERVEFRGFTQQEDIRTLLDESLCLVLPSYQETSPMVIAEAMARGVPVISTTVGGIPNLIRDKDDGILVAPGDVEAIANALDRLAIDGTLWKKYSSNGHAQAKQRFAPSMIVQETVNVYKTILNRD